MVLVEVALSAAASATVASCGRGVISESPAMDQHTPQAPPSRVTFKVHSGPRRVSSEPEEPGPGPTQTFRIHRRLAPRARGTRSAV